MNEFWVVAYMVLADDGGPVVEGDGVKVKWKRVRIPRTHPWRGKRPTPFL